MKHVSMIIMACLFLTGCTSLTDPMSLVRTPTLDFNSMSDLQDYVLHKLHYQSDSGDYWQAPQDTIDRGGGDCEDYAIFVAYYARKFGYDVYLVGISTPVGNHMIVSLNGVLYEPQTLQARPDYNVYTKIARFTVEEAIQKCYIGGSRSVEEVQYDNIRHM